MARNEQEPTVNEYGAEVHPAFGMVRVNRVSSTGAVLFDSEIKHSTYMVMTVYAASRKRDLNRDRIHEDKVKYAIAMSEAQWAAMIASTNSSAVPCTIEMTESDYQVPSIPYAPRMEQQVAETVDAARKALAEIEAAFALVDEKPTRKNINSLRFAIQNAPSNMAFAEESLTEHVENTVTKAKADIEAMVTNHAMALGMDNEQIRTLAKGATLALGSSEED